MSRIKIEFERLPVPAQVAKSRDIQKKMTGSAFYVSPVPSLLEIKAATDELETAYTKALNNDREKKAKMRIMRKRLKDLITELADYVQVTSRGDELKIVSSGFGIRRKKTPAEIPATPVKLKVKPAMLESELEIVWAAVKGAKSYVTEYALDPETFIEIIGSVLSTRARCKALNLETGIKYWFRVRAINTAGYSGWSEPASGRTL